jgi:hypothetical protein
MYMYLPIFLAS